MSDETPERPPSGGLVRALDVPFNAAIGVAVGLLLALVAYAVRVFELLGPVGGTRQYPGLGPEAYFLLLAVVLASATALLVTVVLTAVSAVRLAREL
jgi:hypothetical protein